MLMLYNSQINTPNKLLSIDGDGNVVASIDVDSIALLGSVLEIADISSSTYTASANLGVDYAVALSSANAQFAIGIDRSVAISGTDITVKTSDSLYVNQIAFNLPSASFEGILSTGALTADRTYSLPNNSGTIALTSDIVVQSLADTLAVGNTTGANDILLSDFQRLVGETSLWSLDFGDSSFPYMYLANAAGNQFVYSDVDGLSINHLTTLALTLVNGSTQPFIAKVGTSATTGSASGIAHAYLNTLSGSFDINIAYSVILGGQGINAKTAYTAYANRLGLVNNGASFEGILLATTLTADRTYTLPDRTGTVIVGWLPPSLDNSNFASLGASIVQNTGAGVHYVFDAASDDQIFGSINLHNNNIAYDGSDIQLVLSYQLSGSAIAPGDNVIFNFSYSLVRADGTENANTKVTTVIHTINVESLTLDVLYTEAFPTITGLTSADILNITLERNSTGAGADTYDGDFNLFAMNLTRV